LSWKSVDVVFSLSLRYSDAAIGELSVSPAQRFIESLVLDSFLPLPPLPFLFDMGWRAIALGDGGNTNALIPVTEGFPF